jgi:K319-like protein
MAASVLGSRCQAIRRYLPMALVAVMAFTAAACSTKVGTNTTSSPSAVITPVGSKATSGAGTTSVAITVRSGAGVTLSGKDSDGNGAALASFSWKQTGGPTLQSAPIGGTLLYLTASTVEFTAPQVASNTVLTFQLTVTNALSVSATATATVTVTPANDPDESLVPSVVDNPAPPRRFVVAVAPPSASLTPAAPVCVSVNRSVTYTDRNKQQNTVSLPALPALQANAVWNTAVTAVGASGGQAQLMAALQSTTNPRVVFDVPAFNDIELATMFNQALDANGNPVAIPAASVNQQLVPSDLDSAVLNLAISATPGACTGTAPDPAAVSGTALALGVFASGAVTPVFAPGATTPLANGGSGPLQLTADALLQAVDAPAVTTPPMPPAAPTVETLASAQAYYNAIDPPWQGAPKTDLNTWLDANCFDHTQADFGTGAAGANGAHAVYTNNFDLGFGRDMYFIKCTANHSDQNGNVTAYAGDMAAVVINYGSLEQVALKQAPILTVAMEFQGPGHTNGNCGTPSSTCFTKFYVFAPNDRDGSYQRISSANFDRRGEKYVPGACLSCHGGSITDATYTTPHENVDAAFMPWDLDALLYSDTDPAFTGNLIGGSPYTRAAQEPNLLKLNALAWQTYQTPEFLGSSCTTPPAASATCVDRFAAPVALLTKWYGWCGPTGTSCPTAHPYNDNSPTAANDWPTTTPQGAPTTPAGAPNDLYHAVYAHHCRSCHTQNNVIKKQFNDFATFSSYLEPVTGQSLQQLVFNKAQMPLARLTMDRFWVDYNGGSTSAAQSLANYINGVAAATPGVDPVGTTADSAGNMLVVPPGAPVLQAVVFTNVNPSNTNPSSAIDTVNPQTGSPNSYVVSRFNGARVDLSSSLFVSSFQSTLSLCPAPTADPSACPTPSIDVGTNSGSPGFDTSAFGTYYLMPSAMSVSGKSTPSSQTPYLIQVNQTLADGLSCANVVPSITSVASQNTVIDLSACKPADLGDTPLLQIQVTDVNGTSNWLPTSNISPYTIATSYYTATVNGCLTSGSAVQNCNVVFSFLASSTAKPVGIAYRIFDLGDNQASPAQPVKSPITVILAAQYTAQSFAASMSLGLNTNGGSPSPTLKCIPLSGGSLPTTGVPACQAPGMLDNEIFPIDDTFKLAFTQPSIGGSIGPYYPLTDTLPLTTNLTSQEAVIFTTPSGGFNLSGTTDFVTCDVKGNDILTGTADTLAQPCTGVTIPYTVQSTQVTGTPSCTSTPGYLCNNITVLVNATTSFSVDNTAPPSGLTGNSIFSIIKPSTSCGECHIPPSTPTCPAVAGYCEWQVLSTAAQTLTTLMNGITGSCSYSVSGFNCIKPGDPSQSQMYWNACGAMTAPRDTANHNVQLLTPSQCNALSQWIAEGANLH